MTAVATPPCPPCHGLSSTVLFEDDFLYLRKIDFDIILAAHKTSGKKVVIKSANNCEVTCSKLLPQAHDHLPHLLHYSKTSNLLIFPYFEGGDLASVIPSHGLDEKTCLEYFLQLLDAIETLHETDVAHRDIKPDNIVLDSDGRLVLIDFGLALQVGLTNERPVGVPMEGTLAFMAPELFAIFPPKTFHYKAMDIWSAGVVLVNMLTGSAPFSSASVYCDEYIDFYKHKSQFHSQCSPPVINLVTELLQRDAIKRPATAVAKNLVLDALKRII